MNQKTHKKQETKGLTYITFGEIIASFQTIYSNGTFTCSGNWKMGLSSLTNSTVPVSRRGYMYIYCFFKYVYIYIFNAHLVSIQTRKVSSLPYINEIKNTCSQCTLITQVYTFNTLGVFSQHSYKNITKIAQQHKFVECSKKFTLNYIFKLIQSLCL